VIASFQWRCWRREGEEDRSKEGDKAGSGQGWGEERVGCVWEVSGMDWVICVLENKRIRQHKYLTQ